MLYFKYQLHVLNIVTIHCPGKGNRIFSKVLQDQSVSTLDSKKSLVYLTKLRRNRVRKCLCVKLLGTHVLAMSLASH